MHAPRPYGLLVVGGELGEQDHSFIAHELQKLTNAKQLSGTDSLHLVKDLPDGGYVILQDMGGILKAIARKDTATPDLYKPDGFARLYVPMLYSGVITKARVRKPDGDEVFGEGVGITLTEQSRRRLINYKSGELPAKQQRLQRFVIKPNQLVAPEFLPKNDLSNFIATQYAQQRTTWYSGAMAEVMQIVGGYGRQDFKELPNTLVERAQLRIPDKYIEAIAEALKGYRLPAYNGVPPQDGAFQFDYKFQSTNGVAFDSANKPWLVRIRSAGVHVMPLPIVPVTTTPEFKQYITEVGDDEILKILDRFGGMPSGEGFPIGQDFEAWRRAGVIIKVCDTGTFYAGQAYSNACGWSLNTRGTEGFNTCYTYDDKDIAVGLAYQLSLELGATAKHGWLKTDWQFKSADDMATVNNYLQALFNMIGDHAESKQRELAIRYKIGRQTAEQILGRAKDNPVMDQKEVLYWDNLELGPIAKHNGRVSQVGKGYLYHYQKPKFQPQIKFPSVEAGGCTSFDFLPLGVQGNQVASLESVKASGAPDCDTIMYGYYDGDSLKVVKYFASWSTFTRQTQSNFEPVMTVGEWEERGYVGNSALQGHFYTTDLDFRDTVAPYEYYTRIKGEDKGFDSQPSFAFRDFWSMQGRLWRNRYYTHLTTTQSTSSRKLEIGICIPFLERNAVLHARRDRASGESYSELLELKAMQDPTTYRYWTFHPVFAWRDPLEKQTGMPSPKEGNPVWVEIKDYAPSEYSDFADQGAWLPDPPYDITWLIHPNANEWRYSGGGGAPKVPTYSKREDTEGSLVGDLYFANALNRAQVIYPYPPLDTYFLTSPTDEGDIFYRDACRVSFGESEYANISEKGSNGLRYKWGYTRLADHKSAHHFIGVINE